MGDCPRYRSLVAIEDEDDHESPYDLPPDSVAEHHERLEEAREFRVGFGLEADESTVARLVDAYEQGEDVPAVGGEWLTWDEASAFECRRTVLEENAAALRRHLATHPDASYAGIWFQWSGEDAVCVAFTDRCEEQLVRLRRAAPHPEAVKVVPARYTLAELECVADRIGGERVQRGPGDPEVVSVAIYENTNTVCVEVIADDVERTRRQLIARFGEALEVEVVGSITTEVEVVPWSRYEPDADGRALTLYYGTNGFYTFERTWSEETDREVVVAVEERVPVGPVKLPGANRTARVELASPLGERRVVDAADGRLRTLYSRPG